MLAKLAAPSGGLIYFVQTVGVRRRDGSNLEIGGRGVHGGAVGFDFSSIYCLRKVSSGWRKKIPHESLGPEAGGQWGNNMRKWKRIAPTVHVFDLGFLLKHAPNRSMSLLRCSQLCAVPFLDNARHTLGNTYPCPQLAPWLAVN